jgi:release factor glutamine methyltransferase
MKLSEAIRLLKEAGVPDAEFDAREIFSHIGGIPKYMLAGPTAESSSEAVFKALERRVNREPLGYIIGEVSLYREAYKVTPAVLIPRPDTEVLIDFGVRNISEGGNLLDICTGSGCVAISTLANTKNTTAYAIDISAEALAIAKENAERNGVGARLRLIEADALEYKTDMQFDAILSNPPYIAENVYKTLQKEIFFEPEIAFVGGDDGLEFYRALTAKYKNNLKDGGFIAYEIGYDQADSLCKIAEENGMSCQIIKDLGGNDRVSVLRKKQP